MLKIQYNEILPILGTIERTLFEMEENISDFSQKIAVYNATMQDDVSQEATGIVNFLREEIERMKDIIRDRTEKVRLGTEGLKNIEDKAKNGGLKV